MRVLLATMVFALTIVVSIAAPGTSPIPPPRGGESESAEALAGARTRGVRSAEADIKRGVFRILDFGGPLPFGAGPRVDPQTHYLLESIWGCIVTERFSAEVEAYNGAMRAWHAKHRS